ncbi:hypothetical protein V6x_20660 [Gimesia chilikensis]|uniref:Uncharacterized protein n=1 Tax=Gimesia chilikensis TaxID=2605989 RepID=A0A517WAT0_9PLAN|nr:hypothetical protein [Gimesia chilikensis]QDU02364.1 hypothetical protein V6x_20660 [Gimesia chilikensis]
MQARFLLLVVAASMFTGPEIARSQPEHSQTGIGDRCQSLADQPFEGGYPTEVASKTLDEELYF